VKLTELSIKDMLGLLDGYPLQLPIKGGSVWATYTKVVVTADHDFVENIFGRDKEQIARRITTTYNCMTAEDIMVIPTFEMHYLP